MEQTEHESDTIIIRDTVYIEKENERKKNEYYILERLPWWFREAKIMDSLRIKGEYIFDNRLNPLYLEDDFNGDDNLDLAIPIKEISSEKAGFAIIHGKTNEIFIIGAGNNIKNGLSDDMPYIDIWRINRKKKNYPGIDEKGPLFLKNHSIEIEKSEVGGGLIYWDGNEYAYFHQTC